MKKFFPIAFLAVACVTPFACSDGGADENTQIKNDALEHYANLVLANYEDSYNATLDLKEAIDAFTAAPSEAGFTACKTAWLAARNPYGQTEAFRFYGGPIDDADGPEGLINAWPMDENFIDYVDGQPNAGLINNPTDYPVISKDVLMALNESISEESIFTGYHAIEFLLWGQDLSDSGPGARPYTDYVTGGTASNPDRRADYLKVVVELLLENLASVRDEWKIDGAYRHTFLHELETKTTLGYVFGGLGKFSKGELSGERMFVAIDTKDQENEHSCFSDNTIVDILMNFKGIKNVYYGNYDRTDGSTLRGTGFNKSVENIDPVKADAVDVAFAEAEAAIYDIPSPFDQTIVNNGAMVVPAIDALRKLSDRLVDAGFAIGAEF